MSCFPSMSIDQVLVFALFAVFKSWRQCFSDFNGQLYSLDLGKTQTDPVGLGGPMVFSKFPDVDATGFRPRFQ